MYFDAEAYAEGICDCAAGSTIEVFVDTIDQTVGVLDTYIEDMVVVDEDDQDLLDQMKVLTQHWSELREEIVRREEENGEDTVFAED